MVNIWFKILGLITILSLSARTVKQNIPSNKSIVDNWRINDGLENGENTIITCRLMFYPIDSISNVLIKKNFRKKEVLNCQQIEEVFFLDGLKIDKNTFLKLYLEEENVIKNACFYLYKRQLLDSNNCKDYYEYTVSLSIPVVLNGNQLGDNKKKILENIKAEELKEIKHIYVIKGDSIEEKLIIKTK